MKKIFVAFLFCVCLLTSAQERTIYVTFSHDERASRSGIANISRPNKQFDSTKLRGPRRFFRPTDSDVGFYSTFAYINPIDQPDNPILIKPVSFLETVEHIDWDVYTKNFTLQQYLEFLEQLATYDKVYFIDRAEIKDGMMKMYPVKEMKTNY